MATALQTRTTRRRRAAPPGPPGQPGASDRGWTFVFRARWPSYIWWPATAPRRPRGAFCFRAARCPSGMRFKLRGHSGLIPLVLLGTIPLGACSATPNVGPGGVGGGGVSGGVGGQGVAVTYYQDV